VLKFQAIISTDLKICCIKPVCAK